MDFDASAEAAEGSKHLGVFWRVGGVGDLVVGVGCQVVGFWCRD